MQRPASTEEEEPDHPIDRCDEPQQHVDQINPNGPFHPLNPTVTLGVLMDVHVSEKAEESRKEDTI